MLVLKVLNLTCSYLQKPWNIQSVYLPIIESKSILNLAQSPDDALKWVLSKNFNYIHFQCSLMLIVPLIISDVFCIVDVYALCIFWRTFVSHSVWKQHSWVIHLAFSHRAQCGKVFRSSPVLMTKLGVTYIFRCMVELTCLSTWIS